MIGNFVWAIGSGRGEIVGSRKKFSREKGRAKGRVRLPRAYGSTELGKVASGSAMQSFWLRDRKVEPQVVGVDRSRLPGRGTVREVRRGGRGASNRAKKRVNRFRVRFKRERKGRRLPCLSPGLGDDRRGASGRGDESLESFINRIFHLTRPPGFRRAFNAAERNGRFGRIQCQRGKENSSRGKRKRRVLLCRGTVKVNVGGEAIPASFLKSKEGGRWGRKTGERGTDRRIGR